MSMKAPFIVNEAREALESGNSVVIGLQTTGEVLPVKSFSAASKIKFSRCSADIVDRKKFISLFILVRFLSLLTGAVNNICRNATPATSWIVLQISFSLFTILTHTLNSVLKYSGLIATDGGKSLGTDSSYSSVGSASSGLPSIAELFSKY